MEPGKIPSELRYRKTHEWVRVEGTVATVGITDHAQSQLTDIVFVNLPTVGKVVAKDQSVLVLESVKTVADVYAPGAGRVSAANSELATHPELVNRDPYGKGWLYRIELSGPVDAADLLTPDAYRALVQSSA
ncbi:MAG: glycine cleavage system protein GcvH [Thermoplasmata archaeon]